MKTLFSKLINSKNTFSTGLFYFLGMLALQAQTSPVDITGDGTINILVIGTSNSIEDSYKEFSPNQIATELQNILSADTSISIPVNVVSEDIYKTKTESTGIAGSITANRDYYCHSLAQYYFWPDGHEAQMDNLTGDNGTDWDYVVYGADPFIVSKMPGYYALGVNKIAAKVLEGGGIPLLLMEWLEDSTLVDHFEEFTYRSAEGLKIPIEVIPAGLAWDALPTNLKDSTGIHPTPNGAYLTAAAIYSHLYHRSASTSFYTYNDSIADLAESTLIYEATQTHFTGDPTFISPFKSCEITDPNLIYNHGGTSTENGFLTGLQWVVTENSKTLNYASSAPIHFNYGRSSMGSTHLYNIDSTRFDYSFGYPLQDDATTGLVTMLYGLDKRSNSADVETDLGTARQMINQSELPFARNVPLRTIIAQMLEEIPGVDIFSDPWHLSGDVNKAIGTYMYTIVTSDCALSGDPVPVDSTAWRTWMAHKIGHRTAWNMMYMKEEAPCNIITTDTISACDSYTWIDGNLYTSSNSVSTYSLTSAEGCDSVVRLNLTINTLNTTVSQTGYLLSASESGATYQWLNCPAMATISGANSQLYTATANGDYAVIVSNNGCLDTSSCYTVTGVGIVENSFGEKLLLYPNPTNGNFSIDLGQSYNATTVTITDLHGKQIQSKRYGKSQLLKLQLEEPAGIYFVIINSDHKQAIIRLVKEL